MLNANKGAVSWPTLHWRGLWDCHVESQKTAVLLPQASKHPVHLHLGIQSIWIWHLWCKTKSRSKNTWDKLSNVLHLYILHPCPSLEQMNCNWTSFILQTTMIVQKNCWIAQWFRRLESEIGSSVPHCASLTRAALDPHGPFPPCSSKMRRMSTWRMIMSLKD